ncbi:hypothetical protein [Brachybacterium hainanense]|uniref:Uncharacterized protein n=1 Tax=Brachybacterium hainanense TaxID=1541174 RepID=A0ABV6R849_9MICO
MEHITVAGRTTPFPLSRTAARLLQERLDAALAQRTPEAAADYEARIGDRIAEKLADGAHSIDMATLRGIVDFVDTPVEEEVEPTGLGKVFQGIGERLERRGMRTESF